MKHLYLILATLLISISSKAIVGPITGTSMVCVGSSTTLSDTTVGGTWSSSNLTVAGIGTSSGVVTGNSPGTVTITFTKGGSSVTTTITVNAMPAAIAGPTSVCIYSSNTFTDSTPGGTWASSNIAVGNIDAATGTVYAGSSGATIIFYTTAAPASCTVSTTLNVTTTSNYITGSSSVCTGTTSTYSITSSGGTWSSSTPGVATIDSASGILTTGSSAGTTSVIYTLTGGCSVSRAVTVYATPPPIAGDLNLCSGSSMYLHDNISGGTWSSSNPAVGSVDPTSGWLTAGTTGTATITYTVPGGCGSGTTTATVTVSAAPGVITGPSTLCPGMSGTMSIGLTGGTWSCSSTAIVAVGPGTGIAVALAAGICAIYYNLAGTCSITHVVTVNLSPNSLYFPYGKCVGDTATLTNAMTGGTWSTTTSSIATLSPTGFLTAISAGTSSVTYNLSTGCSASNSLIINAVPAPITGPSSVCTGGYETLSDATAGGYWSATNSNTNANFSTGAVLGVTAGTDTIIYTLSSGCKATAAISVTTGVCTGTPTGGTVTASDTITCPYGAYVTLTLSGSSPGCGISFQWQSSPDDLTYSDISGATNTTYNYAATNITYFRVKVTCTTTGFFAYSTVRYVAAKTRFISHTITSIIDSYCNTPQFHATICTQASTPNITTFYGDGTSANNSLSGTGILYTSFVHDYAAPGTYTVKQVAYDGTIPRDSIIFTYEFATCRNLPIKFYYDANSNCVYDSGDYELYRPTLTEIDSNGVPVDTISATSGFYYKAYGPVGTVYRFHVISLPTALAVTCPSGGIIYDTISASLTSAPQKYFGTHCTGTALDLSDFAVERCRTRFQEGYIYINSSSCIPDSIVVSLQFSTKYYYTVAITSPLSPSSVSGNIANYYFSHISYWNWPYVYYELYHPTGSPYLTAGDTAITKIIITGYQSGTSLTSSDTIINVDTIRASLDPNEMTVSPAGKVLACSALEYTVRFENTGNDTAHNIYVLDTLSNNLDPHSLRIEMASSVMNYVLIKSGSYTIAKFDFPKINLLDSSHHGLADGQVRFNIKTKPGLADGNIIQNRAGIYFDDNPVVMTNTVQNTIGISAISGSNTVCAGAHDTIYSPDKGGVWSVSNAHATISGGVVTGVSGGIDTVSYTISNSCTTRSVTKVVTVNTIPVPGVITGPGLVCAGSSISLTDTLSGGTWSSSDAGTAGVSVTGSVNGIAAGSVTISYSKTNSCGTGISTKGITVNPLPSAGAISGASNVCPGSAITLTDAMAGGAWSATNGHATVVAGLLTGVTLGVDTINYNVSNTCGSSVASKVVTVNSSPSAGTITGVSAVCASSSITLSNTVTGGIWSSSNSNATVAGGIVAGVSAGTDTIKYTVSNTCGTATATKNITINPMPSAGTLAGVSSVCVGATTLLTDVVTGGVWSSTNSNATVTGGVVNGIIAGADTIRYTVVNGCGTAIASKPIVINPLPVAGAITGASSVCVSATTGLINSVTGGLWSVTNANASVLAGVVTGVSAGTDTIKYTVSNSCGSVVAVKTVSINPLPMAGTISGLTTVCTGSSITLTESIPGGTWSASNAHASISGGVVTGNSAGVDTLRYTNTNSCGTATATKVVTINSLPVAGTIAGSSNVCVSATITLTDAEPGGIWGHSNSNTTVAGGVVTGATAGVDTISYSVTNICGTLAATQVVTVNPLPEAGTLTGPDALCMDSVMALSASVAGGVWSSANGNASVLGGVVTGITTGTDTIKYAVTNSCGVATAIKLITINLLPDAGTIVGPTEVCVGSNILLNDATAGGIWTSSNGDATVSGGNVTGVSTGTTTITYAVTNMCGTTFTSHVVNINTTPSSGIITGPSGLCPDSAIILTETVSGGIWSSQNSLASVDATGKVTGIGSGLDSIIYSVTNMCGTTSTTFPITILSADSCATEGVKNSTLIKPELQVYPNPNEGTFTVQLTSVINEQIRIAVTNVAGEKVMELMTVTNKQTEITLDQPAGVYFISAISAQSSYKIKVVVE